MKAGPTKKSMSGTRDRDSDPASATFVKKMRMPNEKGFMDNVVTALGGKGSSLGGLLDTAIEFLENLSGEQMYESTKKHGNALIDWYKDLYHQFVNKGYASTLYKQEHARYKSFRKQLLDGKTGLPSQGCQFVIFVLAAILALLLTVELGMTIFITVLPVGSTMDATVGWIIFIAGNGGVAFMLAAIGAGLK